MMDLINLTHSINETLENMESHVAASKAAMGIKPNLKVAKEQAQAANDYIDVLSVLIIQAQGVGIQQPPDIIRRINVRHAEVGDLIQEIYMCLKIVNAGNSRSKSFMAGKSVAN